MSMVAASEPRAGVVLGFCNLALEHSQPRNLATRNTAQHFLAYWSGPCGVAWV